MKETLSSPAENRSSSFPFIFFHRTSLLGRSSSTDTGSSAESGPFARAAGGGFLRDIYWYHSCFASELEAGHPARAWYSALSISEKVEDIEGDGTTSEGTEAKGAYRRKGEAEAYLPYLP